MKLEHSARKRFVIACMVLTAVVAAWGCQGGGKGETAADGACKPSCEGRQCGDDGCGGSCGECAAGSACAASGVCQPEADAVDACSQSCESLAYECGEVCGIACGTCDGAQEACVEGKCACQPACAAGTCEQPSGCGGDCGPCTSVENCADCVFRLQVVDLVEKDGLVSEVMLALDFAPGEGKPLPTMADLRFKVGGPAELTAVGMAPAVMEAKKSLFMDPNTGKPFQVLADNVHQVLLYATDNTNTIAAGRWLLLKFSIGPLSAGEAKTWTAAPAVVSLVEREETFAPPPADQVLWGGGYGGAVVVWAQASEVRDEE